MAGRTQGEKVDELMRAVATLTARLDNLQRDVNSFGDDQDRTATALAALTTRAAVLEHQVSDLRKGQEEWGRRL